MSLTSAQNPDPPVRTAGAQCDGKCPAGQCRLRLTRRHGSARECPVPAPTPNPPLWRHDAALSRTDFDDGAAAAAAVDGAGVGRTDEAAVPTVGATPKLNGLDAGRKFRKLRIIRRVATHGIWSRSAGTVTVI